MEYLSLIEKIVYINIGVIIGAAIMSIIFMGRNDDDTNSN